MDERKTGVPDAMPGPPISEAQAEYDVNLELRALLARSAKSPSVQRDREIRSQ